MRGTGGLARVLLPAQYEPRPLAAPFRRTLRQHDVDAIQAEPPYQGCDPSPRRSVGGSPCSVSSHVLQRSEVRELCRPTMLGRHSSPAAAQQSDFHYRRRQTHATGPECKDDIDGIGTASLLQSQSARLPLVAADTADGQSFDHEPHHSWHEISVIRTLLLPLRVRVVRWLHRDSRARRTCGFVMSDLVRLIVQHRHTNDRLRNWN